MSEYEAAVFRRPDVQLVLGLRASGYCELARQLPVDVIAGGLRVTETRPMTADIRAHRAGPLAQGQGVLRSAVSVRRAACRMVLYTTVSRLAGRLVVGRELAPTKALAWLHRLQQAFYAEAVDITDPAELARLAD